MRSRSKVVALLAAIAGAVPILAQNFIPLDYPGHKSLALITNPAVQKELKLSDEQVQRVEKAALEIGARLRDDFAKLINVNPDERPVKIREIMKMAGDGAKKAMEDILKPEQTKRLQQIEVQQRGLNDPDNQKALKLSDDQRDKIKSIYNDLNRFVASLPPLGGRDKNIKKIQVARQEARRKAVGVLTVEQKNTWRDMAGEPFDLPDNLLTGFQP